VVFELGWLGCLYSVSCPQDELAGLTPSNLFQLLLDYNEDVSGANSIFSSYSEQNLKDSYDASRSASTALSRHSIVREARQNFRKMMVTLQKLPLVLDPVKQFNTTTCNSSPTTDNA